MPAHHMANSFDASSLAEMLPEEPIPVQPPPPETSQPPLKKRKRNRKCNVAYLVFCLIVLTVLLHTSCQKSFKKTQFYLLGDEHQFCKKNETDAK